MSTSEKSVSSTGQALGNGFDLAFHFSVFRANNCNLTVDALNLAWLQILIILISDSNYPFRVSYLDLLPNMKTCCNETLIYASPCLTAELNVALNHISGKLYIGCCRGTL